MNKRKFLLCIILAFMILLFGSEYTKPSRIFSASAPKEEKLSFDLSAQIKRVHFLEPSNALVNAILPIDTADKVFIVFGSSLKTLNIQLISPTGKTFKIGDPDTTEVTTSIFPDPSDPESAGANYLFTLSQPQLGNWSYKIQATTPLPSTRAVILNMISSSLVRTGMLGGGQDYRTDRDIRLALVTVENQTTLKNLLITASVTKLNDQGFSPLAINFRDDGINGDEIANDGLYTASFQPGINGDFQVSAQINGTDSQGHAFERNTSDSFRIVPISANFSGSFSDQGVDTDNDGLLDLVNILPQINVLTAGQYNLVVTIEASNGKSLSSNTIVNLAPGDAAPKVSFLAEDIRDILAVDGPYMVSEVRLDLQDSDPSATVDAMFNIGKTTSYQLSQIKQPSIKFLAGGNAVAVDADGDNIFDFLDVNIPVSFLQNGSYDWTARLVDMNGTEIGLANNKGAFNAGENTINLRFYTSSEIGRNGVDGPYFVRNLIVFGGGKSLTVDDVLTTPPYKASQFYDFMPRTQILYLPIVAAPLPTEAPTQVPSSTPTALPTVTQTPKALATSTTVQISTATATPTATFTPIPPIATSTFTPVPPIATPTFTSTPLSTPMATPTTSQVLAYASSKTGNSEIYQMYSDGSQQVNLTNHPAYDWGPNWSPDGKQLTFISSRDGNLEVYVMNTDGSNQHRLTNNAVYDAGPSWSPKGDWIAYKSLENNNYHIYLMKPDGSTQKLLTTNATDDWRISWSPDGTRLAFSSLRDGNAEIYLINVDGTGLSRLTNQPAQDNDVAWSPDGKKLAFVSTRDGNPEIYTMNIDGSQLMRLTNSVGADTIPSWSPDGQKLAFTSHRDGIDAIYIMNADGSAQTRITKDSNNNNFAVWRPN